MTARIVLTHKHPLKLTHLPEPAPGDHEVLVEIQTAVTCTVTETP